MKNLMMALALLVGLNAAQAQTSNDTNKDGQKRNRAKMERNGFSKDPEARAKAKLEHLNKELNLTSSQKESIHKLLLDQSKNAQALYNTSDGKRDAERNNMKELRAQTDRKIEALLDNNQKQKYAELLKKQAERRSTDGKRSGAKWEGRKRS
ncbi:MULTISPECIES: hypothetical protein [Sphingobacterium]|uniref:DUF4890 domain-containing protein n=1 Tax=Sphingobacterium populi TaxID=1812824 RepID=A0ABW5UBJ9_9SPHI|nr:hypothetical protein [Sphingobacterium sp. CFCC 11742]